VNGNGNGTVHLDARSHADLIDEARRRLELSCPELAGAGGADPGMTLVELFAWMTGLAIERLGRVPDKLHVALLDLLGVRLDGPAAARTGLRMRLSAAPAEPLEIRAGTEAGTLRTAVQESIVFAVRDDFVIMPLRPAAYVVQRDGAYKEVGLADGVALPAGPDQLPFSRPPKTGDGLYLGFDDSLAHLLMSVTLEASMARGAGVRPEDPPLRWECSQGEGEWAQAAVMEDLTGGFNYGSGTIELQCPERSGIEPISGRRLHWLRCRIAETTRVRGEAAVYTQPPEIYRITAAPAGAVLEAEHSALEFEESLGASDGTPGQSFRTRYHPVLGLAAEETVLVQTPAGDWEPWEEVDSFAGSEEHDRHYVLDLVGGVIRLGPQLRLTGGGSSQRGAIPPKGAAIRMSRYRHGGGRIGNVEAGRVNTLRSAIPGIATVTNPEPARGGVDPQSIESLRSRSALQIRTRFRAVTAEDYEFLAAEASPRVARAHRFADELPGVTLRILPRIDPADRHLTIEELTPGPALLDEVERYLDARKLVGTPVRLQPMRFRGIAVVVNLQASPRADLGRIEREVRRALYTYLNPLIGGNTSGPADGWPIGRSLNQGELYAIVHGFEGVEFIKLLRLYEVDLATGRQAQKAGGRQIVIEGDEVIASGQHIVKVSRREA
jgi:predicted phage baseplate assembly protein